MVRHYTFLIAVSLLCIALRLNYTYPSIEQIYTIILIAAFYVVLSYRSPLVQYPSISSRKRLKQKLT